MARKTSRLDIIRRYSESFGVLGILVVAGLFRLVDITSLPPGLSGGEATIGLSTLHLLHHGFGQLWTVGNSYAPLWTVMHALPVAIIGHTVLALRLWPATIGILAVGATYLWVRDWSNKRTAWIAAFILAVTPWSITLSRSASPAVLALILVPATLFAAGRAYTRRSQRWYYLLSVMVVLDLLSGPLGWTTGTLVLVLALGQLKIVRRDLTAKRLLGPGIVVVAGLLGVIVIASTEKIGLKAFTTSIGLTSNMATLVHTFAKVAAMFNLHGDDNFLHNFNSEPLFNAFIGLMFIAGLLVAVTRLPKRSYMGVVSGLIVCLIPALISPVGAPNAARAAAALPYAVFLAAVGTGYMLDLWYATFPINSAARSTGLAAIMLLLGLSAFQGYVQIFRAWSGSAETYLAYDEAAVAAAHYLAKDTSKDQKYFVGTSDEQAVVSYLNYGHEVPGIPAEAIPTLPATLAPKQFVITASVRDIAAAKLALKNAGGKLEPHYSTFSQNELFYNYETTP